MVNRMDQRSFSHEASASSQSLLNNSVAQLEQLIDQRTAEVNAALANYVALGVSELYAEKEQRWSAVAQEVREVIATLRATLGLNDERATEAGNQARNYVNMIG